MPSAHCGLCWNKSPGPHALSSRIRGALIHAERLPAPAQGGAGPEGGTVSCPQQPAAGSDWLIT